MGQKKIIREGSLGECRECHGQLEEVPEETYDNHDAVRLAAVSFPFQSFHLQAFRQISRARKVLKCTECGNEYPI